jgi:hypothetical protein
MLLKKTASTSRVDIYMAIEPNMHSPETDKTLTIKAMKKGEQF